MKWIGLLIVVLPSLLSVGQSRKVSSFKTSSEVIYTAVDRAGDFYVVLQSGEIQKYDKNGVVLGSYLQVLCRLLHVNLRDSF